MRGYSKQPVLPDLSKVIDDVPQVANYKYPIMNPESEYYALANLLDGLRSENDVGLHYLELANVVMKGVTPVSGRPPWMDDGITLSDLLHVVVNFDGTKHPGYPACLLFPTKGEVLEHHLLDYIQAVVCRMICLEYCAEFCETPEDFYRCFCNDYSCTSIKSEIVGLEKDGRILNSNSIVSSGVEKLLYEVFSTGFKDHVFETYSAIGLGFTRLDSDLLHANQGSSLKMKSDVPKFDSSVTIDESLLNVDVVMSTYRIDRSHRAYKIAIGLERSFMNKIFILGDGSLYKQTEPGHQNTGRDMTANFNTMSRARRSYAVDAFIIVHFDKAHKTKPCCAGDDCSETAHKLKPAVYEMFDFPLRDVVVSSEIEFCSHDWPLKRAPVGQRIYKSFVKLLCADPILLDQMEAFCREFHDHPAFPTVISAASVHRPEVKYLLAELDFDIKMQALVRQQQFIGKLRPMYSA